MPLTYDQFMQKTNGKGTMGTFNVYRLMRKFTTLMRECSSRLFEQLMTDRVKANDPDIQNDPAYKAKDSVMQITGSLASTSNVVPIDFGKDATDKEKETWTNNVNAVIDDVKKLLEPDHFKAFVDFALNSGDPDMATLPEQLQRYIELIDQHFEAGIDPELFAARYKEYAKGLDGKNEEKAEEKAGEKNERNEILNDWENVEAPAEEEDLDIDRINALDIEEFDRRDAFLKELNGIAQGLNARHRGDITGLFSGDSKLMQDLKSAIKDYNDYVNYPLDARFLGKSEEDILDRIVEASDAYYKARGFDPKTGDPVDLDSKSQMGRARLETAKKIMSSVKDRIAHIQHPEMDPDVKVDDTFIHRLETFKNGAENFQKTHLVNNGLVMIAATAAMIKQYGGYASTKKYSEEYEAERIRLKNDETFIQMIDDLSPEEQLKKFNDPMGLYQEYLNKKQMELAPQAEEIVVQNKNVGGEAYRPEEINVENKIVDGEAYRPEKVQEIPFEQQKLSFADLAAETFLRHFHAQQVDAYVKQNPGADPEQFSVEKYLSDNKETYMKEDENFLSFMDTIKDRPTLDKMKAKSPDELHDYYQHGLFRVQEAPQQEKVVGDKQPGPVADDPKDMDVLNVNAVIDEGKKKYLDGKIKVAQEKVADYARSSGTYPNKMGAVLEYAAIATAHLLRAQQNDQKMPDMTDEVFEKLTSETARSKEFRSVVRRFSDQEMFNKATREKGQDLYSALISAKKQYQEYLENQKNAPAMQKGNVIEQAGLQKK